MKTMENTSENKDQVFDLVSKLLSYNTDRGTGLEMCDFIDMVVHNHLGYLCTTGACLHDGDFAPIQAMDGLKDFFKGIDGIIGNTKR